MTLPRERYITSCDGSRTVYFLLKNTLFLSKEDSCSSKWSLDGVKEPVLADGNTRNKPVYVICPLQIDWQNINITAKHVHPTWNIMMIHYEIKNTNIVQQGDYKSTTEYLRPTMSPCRNIKMILLWAFKVFFFSNRSGVSWQRNFKCRMFVFFSWE